MKHSGRTYWGFDRPPQVWRPSGSFRLSHEMECPMGLEGGGIQDQGRDGKIDGACMLPFFQKDGGW